MGNDHNTAALQCKLLMIELLRDVRAYLVADSVYESCAEQVSGRHANGSNLQQCCHARSCRPCALFAEQCFDLAGSVRPATTTAAAIRALGLRRAACLLCCHDSVWLPSGTRRRRCCWQT